MITAKPLSVKTPMDTSPSQVLSAKKDEIKYDVATLPPEQITGMVLEEIGGIELLLISRNSSIAGKNIDKNAIENLKALGTEYGPKTLGSLNSNVRGSSSGLPLSTYVDEDATTLAVDGEQLVVTLQNITAGLEVEVLVEVASSIQSF